MINNFIILPVTAVCAILFWFNGKITDNINIDTVSTVPSVLFIILSVIIFLNFKYKSNYPEDKISYNMFENNLSTDELKIMYRESGLFMSGFLIPLFLLIFYLDNSMKLISILLFFIAVFGGFIYGSFKLRPLIISKRNKEKQELKEQLKKEQGYH
jgi:hypothetical protein